MKMVGYSFTRPIACESKPKVWFKCKCIDHLEPACPSHQVWRSVQSACPHDNEKSHQPLTTPTPNSIDSEGLKCYSQWNIPSKPNNYLKYFISNLLLFFYWWSSNSTWAHKNERALIVDKGSIHFIYQSITECRTT